MEELKDNIIMSSAYCEITDCRSIGSCEKCVELNIANHDAKVRADAIEEIFNRFDVWVKNNPKTAYYWTEFQVEFRKICEQLKEQK